MVASDNVKLESQELKARGETTYTLVIEKCNVEAHQGELKVVATNTAGEAQCTANLTVQSEYAITSPPGDHLSQWPLSLGGRE